MITNQYLILLRKVQAMMDIKSALAVDRFYTYDVIMTLCLLLCAVASPCVVLCVYLALSLQQEKN